ncbi:hypothetical protein [Streptomyces sp. NPDC051211]|uniref:hypothetical protein n=1 Tax=Streptomyces sp. NPDC051211 TaxID=3154643 RepID=UPI00344F6ADF
MTNGTGGIPARVGDVLGVAERVVNLIQALDRSDPQSGSQVRGGIAQLNQLENELKGELVKATYERNRLGRRIVDASKSERELTQLAAGFAAASKDTADLPPGVRDAVRRSIRLRKDMAAWQAGLQEADETIRLCLEVDAVLQQYRADLERDVESLGRRFRAAETTHALARIVDRLRTIGSTVRGGLTEQVENAEAEARTDHGLALDHEDLRIRQLYVLSEDAEVEEELRRLRQDPP